MGQGNPGSEHQAAVKPMPHGSASLTFRYVRSRALNQLLPYCPRWHFSDLPRCPVFSSARRSVRPMRALTEHLQDPEFWKGLGRARDWQDTGAWLFHRRRFIDHIAFGLEVESFFSSL